MPKPHSNSASKSWMGQLREDSVQREKLKKREKSSAGTITEPQGHTQETRSPSPGPWGRNASRTVGWGWEGDPVVLQLEQGVRSNPVLVT